MLPLQDTLQSSVFGGIRIWSRVSWFRWQSVEVHPEWHSRVLPPGSNPPWRSSFSWRLRRSLLGECYGTHLPKALCHTRPFDEIRYKYRYHSGQREPGSNGNKRVLPKAPAWLEPTHQIFSVISMTLIGGVLPLLQRCSRCFLQPQPTDLFFSYINLRELSNNKDVTSLYKNSTDTI